MVIKVGTTKRTEKRLYSYADIEKDPYGWVEANKYLPEDYDMCYLKTTEGRVKNGWYTMSFWDGLHINDKDIVQKWKRNIENI